MIKKLLIAAGILLTIFILLLVGLWPSKEEVSEYREKKKSDQETKIEELRQNYEVQLRTKLPIEQNCKAPQLFYRGTTNYQKPDMAYVWGVECGPSKKAKSLQISVKALTGETKYLPCDIVAATKDDCFSPIQ